WIPQPAETQSNFPLTSTNRFSEMPLTESSDAILEAIL
ncbi:MAG: hypothetical protein ACI805_002115, partial [Candidatus Azotimanducaceae bacterium]